MSVLLVVGSELPTDSDAAVVVTEYVDDVRVTPWMQLTRMLVGRASVRVRRKFGRICMTSLVS